MSNKCTEAESPEVFLKNEFARQRWELFHRAIAHAKQSTDAAFVETDTNSSDTKSARPLLSVVQ